MNLFKKIFKKPDIVQPDLQGAMQLRAAIWWVEELAAIYGYKAIIQFKKTMDMTHEESKLQRQCVQWFRLQYPHLTLFAIPNGGRRGKVEAAIMKGEGVLAGVADLFLMLYTMEYSGLFIEMKTPDGRQSDSQREFERKVIENGYCYKICRTFEEFRDLIMCYTKSFYW